MRLLIITILAVLFYIVGTAPETHVFAKNSQAHEVLEQKTTNNPSRKPKPRTEPLTASPMQTTEVELVGTDTNVATSTPVTSLNNEATTWNRLIAEGFSREQTAGIMGNLQQEHNFNTNDSPGGLGIAQWMGGRRGALLAKANPYDINTQLNFMMEELNGSYSYAKQMILNSGLDGSTLAFQNEYERCGICRQEKRLMYARQILERY